MQQLPPKTVIRYNKILSKFNLQLCVYLLQLHGFIRLLAWLNLLLGVVDWLCDNNRTPLPKRLLMLIISPLLNKLINDNMLYLHAIATLLRADYNTLSITSSLHYAHESYLHTFAQLSSKHWLFRLLDQLDASSASDSPVIALFSFLASLATVYTYCPQYTLHFVSLNLFFYLVVDHIHDHYQQYKVNLTGSWDMKEPKIAANAVD